MAGYAVGGGDDHCAMTEDAEKIKTTRNFLTE
jgi:hypothetical protein